MQPLLSKWAERGKPKGAPLSGNNYKCLSNELRIRPRDLRASTGNIVYKRRTGFRSGLWHVQGVCRLQRTLQRGVCGASGGLACVGA